MQTLDEAWAQHLAPRAQDAPTVVSLFAGCGGSSLGYSMAGYRELLAVEWADVPAATFRLNFPDVPLYHGDIAALADSEALRLADITPGELDILDGSPPCQGFSTAGKRLLDDPRNGLFREYVRLLRAFQPRAFVMENVSGMVKGKMKLIFAEIMRTLKGCGYLVSARLLNAMYFGVPQSRARMIFVGMREDLGIVPSHPSALSRPSSIRDAWLSVGSIGTDQPPVASPLKMRRWSETPRGGNHRQRFSLHRLSWNAPCATVQKTATGSGGMMHPDEPRELTVAELRRVASFPDLFCFSGSWISSLAAIGNSVPPLFMRVIASHVRGLLDG